MMRTRALWFTLGFTSAATVVAQFVHKDLLIDRHSLSSELKAKFGSLEGRVSSLETALQDSPQHPQDGAN
ncbi:unnamed protein product [Cuscuta campestris]|uniref:DUF1664 domain-containing protein n=2 Tax=Cuscuta sect. Cleistogrammica TaxID=1824901 RepID=A0A484L803_9ASTE|nr:hypothetical protein DM860_005719 [Cuscuta australis]VFQ72482.1 unnamed protein product [Cuscuta campestris]VFQ75542.1 unnamed protein product [Cuscuta campestris]